MISHGIVNEDTAARVNDILEKLIDEIVENTKEYLNTGLFLITDFKNNNSWKICNYKNTEDCVEYDYDTSFIKEDGLYFLFGKTLLPTWPLIACRDGTILFYNRFDKTTQKAYFFSNSSKEAYIHVEALNTAELFGFDIELLNKKPLNITVKSTNNISHNLPEKDFNIFIGRKTEIEKLDKALEHKRHFITALDGIGGVGKSAIAIECCNRILKSKYNDINSFEYIIWMSAKNTVFKDGKILKIEQSFEHLEQLLDTIIIVLGLVARNS